MEQQAVLFAERLRKDAGAGNEEQIVGAFELAFGRKPSRDEMADARKLVEEHGLAAVTRALLNANEFVFLY
jgi:hypothetical protein